MSKKPKKPEGASEEKKDFRINQFIARCGFCSRRQADEFIKSGLVTVNNKVVTEMSLRVTEKDEIYVKKQRISMDKLVYIVLNKPKGYITTTKDEKMRKKVTDLIPTDDHKGLFPVGRLDRNTTGLLIFTNDGDFAQKVVHPKYNVKKLYKVKLNKRPSKEHMMAIVAGVELDDGICSADQLAFVNSTDDTYLGIEIHSGKNRVVRRLFEHFDYEVKSLERVMLGSLELGKTGAGKWRYFSQKELNWVDKVKRRQ